MTIHRAGPVYSLVNPVICLYVIKIKIYLKSWGRAPGRCTSALSSTL